MLPDIIFRFKLRYTSMCLTNNGNWENVGYEGTGYGSSDYYYTDCIQNFSYPADQQYTIRHNLIQVKVIWALSHLLMLTLQQFHI